MLGGLERENLLKIEIRQIRLKRKTVARNISRNIQRGIYFLSLKETRPMPWGVVDTWKPSIGSMEQSHSIFQLPCTLPVAAHPLHSNFQWKQIQTTTLEACQYLSPLELWSPRQQTVFSKEWAQILRKAQEVVPMIPGGMGVDDTECSRSDWKSAWKANGPHIPLSTH